MLLNLCQTTLYLKKPTNSGYISLPNFIIQLETIHTKGRIKNNWLVGTNLPTRKINDKEQSKHITLVSIVWEWSNFESF